ncbi:MAG: hypothetical protein EOP51_34440, partial [Sphingobacteriales bacterium]
NTVTADSSYLPWTVKADAGGNFVTNWTVCDCIGDSLRLKAYGLTTGFTAYAYFSDANVTFQVTGLPPGSGNPSITATYTVVTTSNGAFVSSGTRTFPYPGPSSPAIAVTNSQTIQYSFSNISIGGTVYSALGGSVVGANNGSGGQTINVVYNVSCTAPSTPTGRPTQTFCNAATIADLSATGTNIKWYAAATGGTALAPTTALVNGTHYYASQSTGACESQTRLDVTVAINHSPTITVQPTNQSTTYGNGGVTFNVTATGTPASTYQWQLNTGSGFSNISGETSTTLVLSNPAVSMSGRLYRVIATNTCSSTPSEGVSLTVSKASLTVTADNQSKVYGGVDPALTKTVTG